jgi:cytochrome P450
MMRVEPFVFDPFAVAVQDDPYPYYRGLRDRFPLYRNAERDFVAVSRSADITAVMRDWATYSNVGGIDLDDTGRLIGAGNFLESDPPAHDVLRKIVRDSFRAQTVVRLEEFVRAKVAALLDPLVAAPRVNITRELTSALPIHVISHIVGVPPADHDLVLGLLHRAATRRGGVVEIPADSLVAHSALRRYFDELVDERRMRPRDDVVSRVCRAEVDGRPLERDVAVGVCMLLFGAGGETVANFMSSAIYWLAIHAGQRALIAGADARTLQAAVEELIRFDAPVQNTVRTTTAAAELHGEAIGAGERVLLLHGSANRDERRWDEPDRLDVTRRPARNASFGEGIHFCLGAPLARLEARMVLERLLAVAPAYELVGDPVRIRKVNSRGFETLELSLRPR